MTDLTLSHMADAYKRPAIAGSGAIASDLAACASALGEVRVLARSGESAQRAERQSRAAAEKLEGADPQRIVVTADPAEIEDCDLVVESIVEDLAAKTELLSDLGRRCRDADLATTTSSLGVAALAAAAGFADRLFGLHVFNPVTKMELVEVCFPAGLGADSRQRALAWCEALGKRAVEVPDQAGFVVNRLLFPFLFDAVRLLEDTGMDPEAVDACMTLGAGHPMGPLELLDFVGLDVAVAIGEQLERDSGSASQRPPDRLRALVADGRLGRKSGAGLYDY